MRELVYYVAVSVDGFIAGPDGSFEAFMRPGDHEELVLGEMADAVPTHVLEALGIAPPGTRFDAVVMGWQTYAVGLEQGVSSPYQHLEQLVVSSREREVPPEITLSREPLASVAELKQREGLDVWLCGGGELAGSLLPLVDRLVLKRHPVVLGSGIPLFGSRAASRRVELERSGARAFESGVVVEEYRVRRDGASGD